MSELILPNVATKRFRELLSHYKAPSTKIEFPHLKGISFCQWALESGWGTSVLAREHQNYAGMKWREYMKPYAKPIQYKAWDGLATYCAFQGPKEFIEGYWFRLDKAGAYPHWRRYSGDAADFMSYVGPIWVGGAAGMKPDTDYVRDVLRIYRMIAPNFEVTNAKDVLDRYDDDGVAWGGMRPDDDFVGVLFPSADKGNSSGNA
jgi:hypothetical protein